MATQISGSDVFVYNIQQNSKRLHILKVGLISVPRSLQEDWGAALGAGGLKWS